jgi:RHS repeat-associated protein
MSLPAAPRPQPAERPTNALHTVSAGISAVVGLPGQAVNLLNTGFATATNAIAQALPSFPAATLGSPALGLPHAHFLHPPSGPNPVPVPVPIPLPPFGPIMFGTCVQVLINGMPAARSGDLGLNPTCCGLTPIYEVFTGSSKVFIGGARAARMTDITYHCKPVPPAGAAARGAAAAMKTAAKAMMVAGMVAQASAIVGDAIESVEADNSAMSAALGMNAAMMAAQMANDMVAMAMGALMGKDPCLPPGTLGVILMGSPNVLIGGFPMPSWMAIAKGLLKAVKGLKARAGRGRSPSTNRACGRPGEPVDIVTGANVDEFHDYELPGPFPVRWRRYYDSRLRDRPSPMGWGFRHEYQRTLRRVLEGFEYTTHEGEVVEFPEPDGGEVAVCHDGLRLRDLGGGIYAIDEAGQPRMEFDLSRADAAPAPLAALRSDEAWLRFHYDKAGLLVGIEDPTRRSIRLQHDARGRITRVGLVEGESLGDRGLATYEYDAAGHLVRWRDAAGHDSRYEYDASRCMTRKRDRRGYSYHYRYDGAGRCVHTYGDDGLYDVRLQYLPEARCTIATFADGATSHYFYDEGGTITKIVDPCGGATHFQVDDRGLVIEEVDPAGNVTTLLYDGWGGHTGRVDPLGYASPPLHIEPHPPDPLEYRLPASPREWEFGNLFDPRMIEPTGLDRLGPARSPAVDPAGTADAPADHPDRDGFDPPGFRSPAPRRLLDPIGRPIEEGDPAGGIRRWSYDPNGNVLEHQDRDGSVRRFVYSSWNQLWRELSPTGDATTFEYSLRQEITRVTDPGGTVGEFRYDMKDRLVEVRSLGRVRDRYRYDAADNLVEKTDGEGRPLLTMVVGPGNLPVERRLASGENHYFQYDDRGRITRADTDTFGVRIAYDERGRQVEDLRDDLGVAHEFRGGDLVATSYFGRFRATYRRQGRDVLEIIDPTGAVHRMRVGPDGQIRRELANGTTEVIRYGPDGRCLRKGTDGPGKGPGRWSRRYVYSAEGDLRAIEEAGLGTTRYQYDAAHRLIHETLPDGSHRDFRYDAAGNLLHQPGLSDVEMAEGNRLRAANGAVFTYDDRDHIGRRDGAHGAVRYGYNALDMLVRYEIGDEAWTAEYDPLGRRVRKTWLGQTIDFYWDDFRLAAEVRDGQTCRIYVYVDEAALVPFLFVDYDHPDADPGSGRRYYLFTDQIGVPVRVEDDAGEVAWGARIDPYGTAHLGRGRAIEMPLRFPGHYCDPETGLHCNRFRYYSPDLGRYLQPDPLGLAGGINLYSYCFDPLTAVDIDGLTHPKQATAKTTGKRKGGPNQNSNPKSKAPKTTAKTGVKPYETGTYGDLVKKSKVGDGLDLDHQPSHASNLERARAEKGAPLTPKEIRDIKNSGMAVAVPHDVHAEGPTYKGNNTKPKIAGDAANPKAAATRDSKAMTENAASKDKAAANKAAKDIQNQDF